MRHTCTLLLALLAFPMNAGAQASRDEATVGTADDDPEAEGDPDTADGPVGEEPATSSGSVVVDEREDALRREQEAMLEESGESTAHDQEATEESFDHEFQMGIRGGAGVPFWFGLKYSSGPPCDAAGGEFCRYVGSGIIDFDLSFGVTPDVEIVALGRIGMIGVEPTSQNNVQVGLGIRAYISPESRFKIYLAPSLILDLTPAGPLVTAWGDVDVGVRGAFGLQLDIVRYVGLWIEIGVNVLFLRSFGVGPYASGGFQVRFP